MSRSAIITAQYTIVHILQRCVLLQNTIAYAGWRENIHHGQARCPMHSKLAAINAPAVNPEHPTQVTSLMTRLRAV